MNKKTLIIIIVFVFLCPCLWAQSLKKRVGEGVILHPALVESPPIIDGVLDDPAWKQAPTVTDPFIIDTPVYGETFPQKTEIWLAYDYNNLYIAFYCYDTEPGKIKTSISKRDNLGADDYVSVDLDAIGNRQSTYVHMCNPSGIQADLIYSSFGGGNFDPDWVWYSSGKLVENGYTVEIKIPLRSLKFKSGNNVKLNMAFYRFLSRTGANASWPQIDQQIGYFNSLAPVIFDKLNSQLRLEALPSFTYGNIWDRISPSNWSAPDRSTQIGIGFKYGITSSIDTEITINPDFSQVESDEFQILANQRYPIFYNEKRPFFMEIHNQFNLAGLSDSTNMSTAVHTRNIIDPGWGGKISGELGKISAGILVAGDEWPKKELSPSTDTLFSKNANFLFGRFKYSLKGDNYVGLIYTGRKFDTDSNQVIGGDIRFRIKGNHNIGANGLLSYSQENESLKKTKGGAFSLTYEKSNKYLDLFFSIENYARNFRMDSAYYYRTGITRLYGKFGPNFYPAKDKIPWLMRINYIFSANYTHDHFTKMDDHSFTNELNFIFPLQGLFVLSHTVQKEAWMGQYFNQSNFAANGQVQLTNWLYLSCGISYGKLLYYAGPYLGHRTNFMINTILQPNHKFTQNFEYQYEHFTRASDGVKVYDLNILISRTTYQFSKHLFIRALIQYDSYQKCVLADILGSFTLIPGTVVYLGYGSLHGKSYWDTINSKWDPEMGPGKYYQFTQSLFFKASYIIRF